VLSSFGDGDVGDVLGALDAALARPELAAGVDIVVLSFGGYLADDEASLFGAGLQRSLGSALGVSAAGNQSTSRPYFPAAVHGIVGVGGLGQNDRAWFTNFGGWVDACAPAIDVISTFFEPNPGSGLSEPPFTGWARWSGTSFAAPKVAGAIAQDMYLHGGTPHEAWRRLSDHKRYRFPDLGTVFNV
jgi:subtilisin family serine protease